MSSLGGLRVESWRGELWGIPEDSYRYINFGRCPGCGQYIPAKTLLFMGEGCGYLCLNCFNEMRAKSGRKETIYNEEEIIERLFAGDEENRWILEDFLGENCLEDFLSYQTPAELFSSYSMKLPRWKKDENKEKEG